MSNGKWWLVDFCEFQYGKLVETNKPHLSYIALLQKHGLYKGLQRGFHAPKEKDKEKDKDKDKEKEKETTEIIEFFNKHTSSHVKTGTQSARSKIGARLAEGYSVDDCKRAIAYCNGAWEDDEKMKQYIRIATIFGAEKFSGYVDAHYHMTEGEA